MINAKYINPLKQFGKLSYDLVIDEDGREVFRQQMDFPEDVTEADMQKRADDKINELSQTTQREVVIEETVTRVTTTVDDPALITDNKSVTVTINKPVVKIVAAGDIG